MAFPFGKKPKGVTEYPPVGRRVQKTLPTRHCGINIKHYK